ncbi:hypothetical protein NAP1_00225 [Erythrobacter sp. NAP1]|uniref:DUF418 domain-containing protein n=1 Tax=Erythrobacter sp. NAP1 TaxID=237727 RepID=UPI00006869B8|nr:DUF418 domain-containing protein [Erythrobacter sp. NAP1]EAQ29151.1 hypothetical protein NAP1_00225 [Erythrobacter sp. NAP1]
MSDAIAAGPEVFSDEASTDQAPVKASERISSLDFIRGIAVMGILAANIVAFGQPFNAYIYPEAFIGGAGDPGGWMWIAQFILVDGKMRGLFTILFGAGMYLFMERTWARGGTRKLQLWRLFILLIFGLIHFFFIWIGDILAMYALIGFIAVACMRWTVKSQLVVGLVGYFFGALLYLAMFSFPYLVVDTSVGDMPEMAEARGAMEEGITAALEDDAEMTEIKQSGDYGAFVERRVSEEGAMVLANPALFFFETFPLMLLGMALYRLGFFSGAFNRSKMVMWGWIGVIGGGLAHLGLGLIVKQAGFTFYAGNAAFLGWSPLPRLAMVLGLAALLVTYSPAWTGWLAERVRAAGRAAFTNYLGTSIVMLFVFHGWALGLFGELNRPQLYLVTALTWVLMLAWSKPWLDRYRYGPLEWLWRCLTYRQLFALKR